jgi:hypothetical protein
MKLFPIRQMVAEGRIVAKTRFPWYHRNFSGWSGWRLALAEGLRTRRHKSLYILCRFLGRLVFIDADHSAFWKMPRIDTTDDGMSYRIGWMYWALCFTRGFWYPNPRRFMPGFSSLPHSPTQQAKEGQ